MRKLSNRKLRAPRAPKRDISSPAYRRFGRTLMRPDDSLFVAGVIVSGALFAWLLTSW
jgi:hypothetical protein